MWRRFWPSILLLLHACSGGGSSGGTTSIPLPQWSSLRHDIGNSAIGSGAVGENGGTPQVLIDGGVTSTPAIAIGGQIYVGTMSGVVALEEEGGERWRFETCESPARATSVQAQERCIDKAVGPVSISPAVTSGDEIVLVAASGCVFAVKDEGTGLRTCRWAASLGAEGCEPSATSCIGSSPQVVVDSRDLTLISVFVGTPDGGVQALNGNGTLRWRFPSDGGSLGGAVTSTPALLGFNAVFVATPSGILHALDAAGRPLWGVPIRLEPDATGVQPSPATVTATYLPNAGGEVVAYNPNGTVKWSFSVPTEPPAPVVGSVAVATQLVQEPDSTSSAFEPIIYLVDETGMLYGVRDNGGTVVKLPRCSLSRDITCTIDSCPVGKGPCGADGLCSGDINLSCTVQSCTPEQGTCEINEGMVRILPEGASASTSPSISGDLFAVVGTATGDVCARQLIDEAPASWPDGGCVDVEPDSDQAIADSPVVDSRGRIFVLSDSSLYAIQ
jgi:outer membrane protein assembly factor BamB